jgi:predicted metalloprotease
MRWRGRRQSTRIEDRRGRPRRRLAVGGGAGMLLLVLAIALLGGDPSSLLQQLNTGTTADVGTGAPLSAADQEMRDFVAVVLGDTEEVWHELFRRMDLSYREPNLVLFTGQVRSACGFASAAVGPFYCPGDRKVYIDLAFYEQLRRRFRAPGDFAQAYVIAHEIGHHVQNLLGITDSVHSQRGRLSEHEYNQLSVRLELQADFLAGVWAHHAHRNWQILEPGDIEEALRAASAIGDDAIQRQTQGHVVPDSFTHGTSEQRVRWFRRGLESGDLAQGDTFNASRL